MDVSKPFAAISPGVDADVLVVLAGSTKPRSGRELARRAGRSNTGVQHVLDHLVEHGLVDRGEVGRAFLYELNRDHLLASTVEQMAGARAELVRRLRDAIGAWEVPPVHASLFGSALAATGTRVAISTSSLCDLPVSIPTTRPGAIRSTGLPAWCAAGPAITPASPRFPRASFLACARIVRPSSRKSARTPLTLPEKPPESSSGKSDGSEATPNSGVWRAPGAAMPRAHCSKRSPPAASGQPANCAS